MLRYGERLIQLWNDWQLSAAVLLSLTLQLLLLTTAHFRRSTTPSRWSKGYFWVLYIGSRFIAPYALGILSRASKGDADADADIQALWAALMLFHLAGVDDFSALSLEDNKLWERRAFEMVINVVTTGYVSVRYFLDPAFRRFIGPFALISLAGVMKYVEQVFALKRATMDALIESVLGIPDASPDYGDFMDRTNGILRSGCIPSLNASEQGVFFREHTSSEQGVVGPNSGADPPSGRVTNAVHTPKEAMEIIDSARSLYRMFKVLFADGIFSFKERRHGQAQFRDAEASWRAFKIVEIELSFVYDRLYTKASVSRGKIGMVIRVASLLLTLAGSLYALIVTTLHARQYRLRHRSIMYTLLAGAVLTDIVILVARVFNIRSPLYRKWLRCCSAKLVNQRRWSGYMAQSNLVTFCLKNLPSESELAATLRRLSPPGGSKEFFINCASRVLARTTVSLCSTTFLPADLVKELEAWEALQKYFEQSSLFEQTRSRSFWKYFKKTWHVQVRDELQDFIFKQLKYEERQLNNDRERESQGNRAGTSYSREEAGETSQQNHKKVRDPVTARGDQVLKDEKITGIEWSLQEKEFDESLLIWHIATDLCFREENSSKQNGSADDDPGARQTRKHMDMATELSNYLFYIMVVHPLMLSSSTTMAVKRCRDTCAEARRHFLKRHIEAKTRYSASSSRKKEDASSNANEDDKAVSEENAHVSLLKVVEVTPLQASKVKGDKSKSVLWDGCSLAHELTRTMADPARKWEVICKVWVEMLCHAAVQCGGYQHAERLKEGGELITFVCLLMTHLGMGKHYKTEVGDSYPHLSAYDTA
ncbi:hypothetical protein EJB05_41062, partial [Eragrostis curvula]